MTTPTLEEALALYETGESPLTDKEYDDLVAALPADHPLREVVGKRGKTAHSRPMLSLNKAHSADEVAKWRTSLPTGGHVATPKLDGVALSLTYTDNYLTQATTRGDGEMGEDVTHVARLFVPRVLLGPARGIGTVEVRGEAVLPTSITVDTNRRNVVAGWLARHEAPEEDRQIVFVAYDTHPMTTKTYSQMLGHLVMAGFIVPPFSYEKEPVFDVPFETDGIVFTANDLMTREVMGATSHHPRWAIALKPRDEDVTTTLLDVVWQVGRTGIFTPVALVEPVKVGQVTVSRTTLHNLDRILALGLEIGCTVRVTRRGSVIPHIEEVVSPGHTPLMVPSSCPACGETTYDLKCPQRNACPGVIAARLDYFCKMLKIDGVGPEVALSLVNDGVTDIALLYLSGAAGRAKIREQLRQHLSMPLSTFLTAMGVDGMGPEVARKTASVVGDIDCLLSMSLTDLEAFLGTATAQAVFRGVADLWLLSALHVIEVTNEHVTSGPLAGQSFVFTGELARWTRAVAQRLVKDRGGATPSGVSKTTTWLVVGAAPGQDKTSKAAKYGVKTLTEASFSDMLGPVTSIPRTAVDLTKKP